MRKYNIFIRNYDYIKNMEVTENEHNNSIFLISCDILDIYNEYANIYVARNKDAVIKYIEISFYNHKKIFLLDTINERNVYIPKLDEFNFDTHTFDTKIISPREYGEKLLKKKYNKKKRR